MRETKPELSVGDIMPIHTSMDNIVYCEILDAEWPVSYQDGTTVPMLDEKCMIAIADEIRFRRENKFDCVSLHTGAERSGKSMLSFVKKKLYESPTYQDEGKRNDILSKNNFTIREFTEVGDFDLDDITFDVPSLRERLNLVTEGCNKIISNDEAGVGMSSLKWWSPEQINLYIEFQTIGIKRLITDLNLPHRTDLNNRFRDRRVAIWGNVTTQRKGKHINRGFVEFRRGIQNQWELGSYWEPWLIFRFPNLGDSEDWERYETKKRAFVKMISEQDETDDNTKAGKLGNKYHKEKILLMKEMLRPSGDFSDNKSYRHEDIAKLMGVTRTTVTNEILRFEELENAKLIKEIREKRLREVSGNGNDNTILSQSKE